MTKTTKAIDAPDPQGTLAIRLASRESIVRAAFHADLCSTGNAMTTGVYELHWFCDTVLNHPFKAGVGRPKFVLTPVTSRLWCRFSHLEVHP
ncbi:MAG: hypothetical protein ACTSYX_09660 [Candidatus Thorarchaeota archaeon]